MINEWLSYRCHLLRVVDDFMASSCWMGLVGDMSIPAEVDKILRATAVKNKVGQTKLTCQFLPWTSQLFCGRSYMTKLISLVGWISPKLASSTRKMSANSGIGVRRSLRKIPQVPYHKQLVLVHSSGTRSCFIPVPRSLRCDYVATAGLY